LTLVIDEVHGVEVPTRFIESTRADPNDAACDLRVREGTVIRNIGLIDLNSSIERSKSAVVAGIMREWCAANGYDAVAWTDLRSNFEQITSESYSVEAAIEYLRALPPTGLAAARHYIEIIPKDVTTKLRSALHYCSWWTSVGANPGDDLTLPTPTPRLWK